MEKTLDLKFRQVFWAWQNYFISTETAMELLECSRKKLEENSILFMTSPEYRDLYKVEFGLYMKDYSEKPVRGYAKIDEETRHQFLMIGRSMAVVSECKGLGPKNSTTFEWSFKKVVDACKKYGFSNLIPEDFYRYRLNYKNAKHLIHDASEKFLRGPAYIKTLKGNLSYIDYLMKNKSEEAEENFLKIKKLGISEHNRFVYIGYCSCVTKNKKAKSKTYSEVRMWLPSEIIVEQLSNADEERKKLADLINKIEKDKEDEYVVIVASPKCFGEDKEEAINTYSKILDIAHVVIARNPELSTIDDRYNIKVEMGDKVMKDKLKVLFNEAFSKNK